MIFKLAQRITLSLKQHKHIQDEDCELFEYGIFLVLSQILYSIICLVCGIIFGCIVESIVFYISFMVIREYAGGFHASTELRCFILSTSSILLSTYCISIIKEHDFDTVFIILLSLSSLIIILLTPLDTEEKPLTKTEKINFRKKTLVILVVLLIILIATFNRLSFLSFPIGTAIILEGVLLTLGKLKKVHREKQKSSL